MNLEKESIPQSNSQLNSNDQGFAEINFFSPGSRVNRLRYWAHSALMTIPCFMLFGIGSALATQVSAIFWGVVAIAYIAMLVFSFILIIQRLHDLDKSGWLSLLIFVPFANIYLLVLLIFFAGTPGRNTYGLPTPPNKTWHWIAALGFPLLFFILGIVAAIGFPAYQQYLSADQQEEIQSLEATDLDGLDGTNFQELPNEAAGDALTEDREVINKGEDLKSAEVLQDEIVGDEVLENAADLGDEVVQEDTLVEIPEEATTDTSTETTSDTEMETSIENTTEEPAENPESVN